MANISFCLNISLGHSIRIFRRFYFFCSLNDCMCKCMCVCVWRQPILFEIGELKWNISEWKKIKNKSFLDLCQSRFSHFYAFYSSLFFLLSFAIHLFDCKLALQCALSCLVCADCIASSLQWIAASAIRVVVVASWPKLFDSLRLPTMTSTTIPTRARVKNRERNADRPIERKMCAFLSFSFHIDDVRCHRFVFLDLVKYHRPIL